MTDWQPEYRPRQADGRPQGIPPQWQPGAPPRRDDPWGGQPGTWQQEAYLRSPQWQQPYQPPASPQYQQQWKPPRRRSWLRRHWLLSSLGGAATIVIAIVAAAAASSHGQASPAVASLAACTSHHAITSRQWLEITKDPAAAKGQCITIYGEVTQFDSVTGDSVFRAQAGGVKASTQFGIAAYPTNALFDGSAKQLAALVQDDLFTAQVTVAGSQSYDTTLGGSTTVPVFRVDSVTRTGHLDT